MSATAEARPAARGRPVSMPMILGLLVVGTYLTTLRQPFMGHDFHTVVEPMTVEGSWRPLTDYSFEFNRWFAGDHPSGYRVVNIALLAAAGCLAGLWLETYTRPVIAWSAAALFVAHPVHAQTVMDLVGRADLLALAGLMIFALAQRRSQLRGKWSISRRLTAYLGLVVALGAKETGLAVIVVALAQCRWASWPQPGFRGQGSGVGDSRIPDSSGPTPAPLWGATLGVLLPMLALYGLLRTRTVGWAQPTHPGPADLWANPLLGLSLAERLPSVFWLLWFYVKQVFWTDFRFALTPLTPPTWDDAVVWLGVAVSVAAAAGLARTLWRPRWHSVAWALLLGHLLLSVHVIHVGQSFASNLLMPAVTLSALMLGAALAERMTRLSPRPAALVLIPCVILLAPMTYKVLRAQRLWSSPWSLAWNDYKDDQDNPVTLYNLACAEADAGRFDRAEVLLERALRHRPGSRQVMARIAMYEHLQGKFESAAAWYGRILELHPDDAGARAGLERVGGHLE